MSKKAKKQKHSPSADHSVTITFPNDLCREEMKNIIADAIIRAEKIKEAEEERENLQALEKVRKITGYKENSRFNTLRCLKLLRAPKEEIVGDRVVFVTLRSALSALLSMCCWILVVSAGFLFLRTVIFVLMKFSQLDFSLSCFLAIFKVFLTDFLPGLIALLAAPIFRVISIEIEKMKNRNLLIGVFASFAAVASIIATIIAGG